MSFSTLILAAGAGTRMKSALPKVAHEVLGKPLVRWVVDAARAAGSAHVITVVGLGRDKVAPLVSDTTVVVQEEQLGTGHAVMMARHELEALEGTDGAEDLLVLCGDTPLLTAQTIGKLVAAHRAQGAAGTVMSFVPDDPYGYGRIIRDAHGSFARIIEERDAAPDVRQVREANSGMYCFDRSALLSVIDSIDCNTAGDEFYLTKALEHLRDSAAGVCVCPCDDADEALGINDRVQLAAAGRIAQARVNEAHLRAGVSMLDPSMVWIGPDVTLGRDVSLYPLTFLMGATSIGEGCVLGPNTQVRDSVVGRDCSLVESIVLGSTLEDGVDAGPRAYLRPGTHMKSGSHVGTHVEIKNSTIGNNSKVPHLSYIGDTTIGADVNIGAGTITCNYDGTDKHRTIIGDNTFVGSNTMLIAPVTVGSDAKTGAGSVITDDVPDGMLGIARALQVNKPRGARSNDTTDDQARSDA
ncbi:MAG: bifunctional UDP-N-acetylglucosamine diphosphorylase/glucosamine-1-phosphate N-acetyltransferase GlmU [Coriobacteriales bacterium]|jgi:bifunctional UDP-N-acetylglucosamine pyrophosphorylase/glucosamine-1-phosphate N-acetyltransferase|nr:bifunctional UDP-N-acetylglucosamine diphosphorylase/glucosamine-1-phosphate N-acetyltransferase GlmU [Coriobacteriales bacterium]